MLYNLLNKLFRQDLYAEPFIPKPKHLWHAISLLFIGSGAFVYEWYAFGFVVFSFGVMLGITIILGMNWDKATEYWNTVDRFANTMMKIKDPAVRNEVWKSMGFNHVPTNAHIIETVEDKDGIFQGSFIRLPFPNTTMQLVADKVLYSKKGEFPTEESELGQSIPNYRKVKKYLKRNNYIVPNNPKNVRLGYSFNRKGLDVLYQYASEGIKLELKRNGEENEQ